MIDRILIGDCLTHLKTIEDNSIALRFANPPFNLNKKYSTYRDQLSLSAYLV